MNTSESIRYYRKKAGLTQKQLGKLSGTSETTIKQYENDKRQPRLEQLHNIATALKVPIVELMGFNKEDIIEKEGTEILMNTATGKFEEYTGKYYDLSDRFKLTEYYNNLNKLGKAEALKRVHELTEIPRYTEPDN